MFVNANTLPEGGVIETDLCVIGGGAAGITLAQALVGKGREIVLLESGGFEYDEATQELYDGDVLGNPMPALVAQRLRYFGGSTNHWQGFCRPLDEADFQKRSWVPDSGWPFERTALEPYYERAAPILDLPHADFDPAVWQGDLPPLFKMEGLQERLRPVVFQLSPPTRFGEKYRALLKQADDVRVHLYANVVEIETDEAARTVQALRVATLDGRHYRVRARTYVLATGGIENARLLLASNRVAPQGLGNAHDLVGRYFMDHPSAHAATVYFNSATDVLGGSMTPRNLWGGFALPAAASEQERLLGFKCYVRPGGRSSPEGYLALKELVYNVWRGDVPDHAFDLVADVAGDLDGAIGGVWERWFGKPSELLIDADVEVTPNPDSRVVLSTERDALGMPRAAVDWRLTELDRRSFRRGVEHVAAALSSVGLGRTRIDETYRTEDFDFPDGSYHHMGTTRMANDPREGVVDREGRVHGMSNLYIAGSSVFPTAGFAGPTMTIVALSLRLADHLEAVS
jgi:choline dehydrogenase-like flavoprotein